MQTFQYLMLNKNSFAIFQKLPRSSDGNKLDQGRDSGEYNLLHRQRSTSHASRRSQGEDSSMEQSRIIVHVTVLKCR